MFKLLQCLQYLHQQLQAIWIHQFTHFNFSISSQATKYKHPHQKQTKNKNNQFSIYQTMSHPNTRENVSNNMETSYLNMIGVSTGPYLLDYHYVNTCKIKPNKISFKTCILLFTLAYKFPQSKLYGFDIAIDKTMDRHFKIIILRPFYLFFFTFFLSANCSFSQLRLSSCVLI